MPDRTAGPDGPSEVRPDTAGDLSYADYLDLDRLLAAQHPRSPEPDEMLFIIQHQTSELWMKLMLHELGAAIAALDRDSLPAAFKTTARVSRILQQLVSAWDVLATMTPSDYSAIRPHLASSSGFQSYQYRAIEFTLGAKNPAMIEPHRGHPERLAVVVAAFEAPSLYDRVVACIARRGFPLEPGLLSRDVREPKPTSPMLEAAFATIYRDPERWFDLYELAEELVDLEDAFRLWRFRHMTTVQRIIGMKRGTGGTAGVGYLRKVVDGVLFPELWAVRTAL